MIPRGLILVARSDRLCNIIRQSTRHIQSNIKVIINKPPHKSRVVAWIYVRGIKAETRGTVWYAQAQEAWVD